MILITFEDRPLFSQPSENIFGNFLFSSPQMPGTPTRLLVLSLYIGFEERIRPLSKTNEMPFSLVLVMKSGKLLDPVVIALTNINVMEYHILTSFFF